jgi:hypothetical protein
MRFERWIGQFEDYDIRSDAKGDFTLVQCGGSERCMGNHMIKAD